jgi:hypothetical protein
MRRPSRSEGGQTTRRQFVGVRISQMVRVKTKFVSVAMLLTRDVCMTVVWLTDLEQDHIVRQ